MHTVNILVLASLIEMKLKVIETRCFSNHKLSIDKPTPKKTSDLISFYVHIKLGFLLTGAPLATSFT